MAIGTNALVDFWNAGTTNLEETGGSALVTDGSFSLFDATDLDDYTHTDDSPWITGWFQVDSAGTPDDNSGVVLYGRIMNATDIPDTTDTNDSPIPTATFQLMPLTFIPVKGITTEHFVPFEAYLPNTEPGTVWQFGFQNKTGASINAGWSVHVRAKSRGPQA